jgi:hypothetical protein
MEQKGFKEALLCHPYKGGKAIGELSEVMAKPASKNLKSFRNPKSWPSHPT